MARAGFITGLKSEADCIAPHVDPSIVRIAGMRPDAATRAAQELAAAGCDVLVSVGLAGALIASLAPGDVILSGDEALERALRGHMPRARIAPLAGSDTVVAAPRDKVAFNQRTGAVAVDMESHRVAEVARERGLRFLAVRVIADRLTSTIPRAAVDAVGPDGEPRVSTVLAALARRPWEIFALAGLAAQSRAAHRSLRDVAPFLGRVLGG